jgi:hypothetical protein
MNDRSLLRTCGAMAMVAWLGSGCAGGVGSDGSNTADITSTTSWSTVQAQRNLATAAYFITNHDDFTSFKNAALGDRGIPMVMFRLFPIIFPDLWDPHFRNVGLDDDTFEPGRVLPLGMGHIPSNPPIPVPTPVGVVQLNVHVANLTCAGCHTGRVIGPDGAVHNVLGAPSTQFDQFRSMVFRTVNDPRYTAQNFLNALNSTPLGYIYGDPALAQQEALERAVFNAPATPTSPSGADQFLGALKAGANAGAARFAATLGAYTYNVPNAPDLTQPTPGYLDAIGAGITIVVDPTQLTPDQVKAALPPAPAEIDIMSVWQQQNRPAAQWDGSIQHAVHRNLGAEVGVIGDPTQVNMDNADRTTRFTQKLPAPVYPFNVDIRAAVKGQELFGEYCAGCHKANNATIFPATQVGTDANRANIWSPYSIAGLVQALRIACTDPVTCNNPDGTPIADSQITRSTGGYMALPLDGIWARAPYLHNGSVPNLATLLVPKKRPAQFYRGNIAYDQTNVGFANAAAPGAVLYDTTKAGHSNTGHTGERFLGDVDWGGEPDQLYNLLEYLKTL